ncbi:MAG: metal-dependent hydrolase [Acidimicrobiia bacterium]|nr:metal-dependent hydrolase [Acidimicrobiia bacterium]
MAVDRLRHRRVRFEFPDDLDPMWVPHLPEFAAAANAVSLGMPYAEPLFIKAVRSTFDQIDDDLRERSERYIRQETGHHTQHQHFNDLIARRYPSTLRLQRLMRRCADWVWRRSPRFRVAYAAGGETISYGVARWTERNLAPLMDRADPLVATLFLWHLAEEIEHKSSTYDVFEATDGSKLRYALAMTVGFVSISTFTAIGTFQQLWAERRLWRPITWFRLARLAVSLAFTLIPVMVVSALPGHHPRQFTDPSYLPMWLSQYDAETDTMPMWRGSNAA